MKSITESTLVPISLVISLLGGSGFITYVYFQTEANAKAILEIQGKQNSLEEIKLDIAVIKEKMEYIEKKLR